MNVDNIISFINRKLKYNYKKYNIIYNTKKEKRIECTIPNKYHYYIDSEDMLFRWVVGILFVSLVGLMLVSLITMISNIVLNTTLLILFIILTPIIFVIAAEPSNTGEMIITFLIGLMGSCIGVIIAACGIKFNSIEDHYFANFLINHILW